MTGNNKTVVMITNATKGKDDKTSTIMVSVPGKRVTKFISECRYYEEPTKVDGDNCDFSAVITEQVQTTQHVPYFAKQSKHDKTSNIKEIKIKIFPDLLTAKCGCTSAHDCPKYVAAGKCTSPFVRNYIGKILLTDRYTKQK